MMKLFNRIAAVILVSLFSLASFAQPVQTSNTISKPYKVLTQGKQITVKSTKNLKNVMVWTSSGHRILEQKNIKASSFSFTITVNEKVIFLMIEFEGTKPYTEKIGLP